MRWTLFVIVTVFLSGYVKSHPVSFDGESNSNSKVGNDILSQSELSPRLRRAEDSIAIPTSTDKEDFSTSASNNADTTQYAESRSVSDNVILH